MTSVRTWPRGRRRLLAVSLLLVIVVVLGVFAVWPFAQAWERQNAEIERLNTSNAMLSPVARRVERMKTALAAVNTTGWRDLVIPAAHEEDAGAALVRYVSRAAEVAGWQPELSEARTNADGGVWINVHGAADRETLIAFLGALRDQEPFIWSDSLSVSPRSDETTRPLDVTIALAAVWVPTEDPV